MVRILAVAIVLVLCSASPRAQVFDTFNLTVQSSGGCNDSQCASFALGAYPAIAMQISGTFSATLTFEATADGVNWVAVSLVNTATGTLATTATAAGIFATPNPGFMQVRMRCTTYASGVVRVVGTRGYSIPVRSAA